MEYVSHSFFGLLQPFFISAMATIGWFCMDAFHASEVSLENVIVGALALTSHLAVPVE